MKYKVDQNIFLLNDDDLEKIKIADFFNVLKNMIIPDLMPIIPELWNKEKKRKVKKRKVLIFIIYKIAFVIIEGDIMEDLKELFRKGTFILIILGIIDVLFFKSAKNVVYELTIHRYAILILLLGLFLLVGGLLSENKDLKKDISNLRVSLSKLSNEINEQNKSEE